MLDDVFEHFGDDKIKAFQGEWRRGTGYEHNYNQYIENLKKPSKVDATRTMEPEEAAWETWTGKYMKDPRRGFTKVTVSPHPDNPNVVWPFFEKTP